MTNLRPPMDRALDVLKSNKFFVLGTADAQGPWTAAVAFTPFSPADLYFMSQRSSRHAQAIGTGGQVSGVIYDSRAKPEDVESIQFSGWAEEMKKDLQLARKILKRSAELTGSVQMSADEEESFLSGEDLGIYLIRVEKTFVLDQQAWQEKGVDARQEVDTKELFRRFESSS